MRLGPAPVNAREAVVTDRLYRGTLTRLTLAIGGAAVEATLAPDLAEAIAPGDRITVNLPPASLWVMPGAA